LRFNVQKAGNVGVNVVLPEEKFHVSGTAKFDSGGAFGPSKASVLITNTMQGCGDHSLRVRDHFYVSACGKVGVKTAVPQAELHVTGTTKTTALTVDEDAAVEGTFSAKKFAHHKGLFQVDKLTVEQDVALKGRTVLEQDVVIKGNLYVQKEVKMIGQTGSVSEMMESRLALIEESHKSLQESHDAVKEHNKELKDRVMDLEKRLVELATSR
jgi:cytoskeletal protein CcmA (bactofilin family)